MLLTLDMHQLGDYSFLNEKEFYVQSLWHKTVLVHFEFLKHIFLLYNDTENNFTDNT